MECSGLTDEHAPLSRNPRQHAGEETSFSRAVVACKCLVVSANSDEHGDEPPRRASGSWVKIAED